MLHTLNTPTHQKNESPVLSWIYKILHAFKLFTLFVFWHYGVFILFFAGWCLACYLYFDVITNAVLPPGIQDDIMSTPQAGKMLFIVVAGRKVALKCNQQAKTWKAKYIKGH